MKLFYSPGACSLAGHIALIEAGLAFEPERWCKAQEASAARAVAVLVK